MNLSFIKFMFFSMVTSATSDPTDKLDKAKDNIKEGKLDKAMESLVEFIKEVYHLYGDKLQKIGYNIFIALIIFLIGRKLVKIVTNITDKALNRSKIEISVSKFLVKLVGVSLNVILFMSIIDTLGAPTTSLMALVGSAGLAIGLALQGSLANFAGGVLILILKPFKVNDTIIANGIEGKVKTIDVFYTKLVSPDNKKIVIPNGALANSPIQNVPDAAERRLELLLRVDYEEDFEKVKRVLMEIAHSHPLILKENEIDIFVESINPGFISIGFRAWTLTNDYWVVRCNVLEKIVYRFREESIKIPYNQMDVSLINGASEAKKATNEEK